jgi:hypothetical protein
VEPVCGESRREVENTCGRNISRTWEILEIVDAPGHVAKREETLAVSLIPKGNRRERERRNSEEDLEHEGMNLGNLFRGPARMSIRRGRMETGACPESAVNPMNRGSSGT